MDPRLRDYVALLREWAPRVNLVAVGDLERLEERHIEDCARAAPLLDEAPEGPCLDVGAGAGLPGIVLAVLRPERAWTLLEPRSRRAAFLEEAARKLGLSCRIVQRRAEDCARDPAHQGLYAFATARALAPPQEAFSLLTPLLRANGIAAVWTGAGAEVAMKEREWAPGIATMIKD